MTINRTLMVSALFILVALVAAVWLYPQLPAQVPVHWDLHGQINGSLPRLWGAAFPVLIILALAVLTVLLPLISPRQFEIQPFAAAYGVMMLAVQGMMLAVGLAVLLAGAGYALPIPAIAMLAVGVLLMVLGNYMGKLRKNFFIGIRTPWTLASDAVWERTHRLAGWLFVAAGLVMVASVLVGAPIWLPLGAIAAATLLPVVYSLWIYRRLDHAA
jgi:uncharacterized membrane protein